MTDTTRLVGGKSQEEVAFALFKMIGEAENQFYPNGNIQPGITREWILETYATCLRAAKGLSIKPQP